MMLPKVLAGCILQIFGGFMSKKSKSIHAVFDGVDLVELVKRILTGKATDDEQRLFASFCGRGLRNWQDLLAIYRRNALIKK